MSEAIQKNKSIEKKSPVYQLREDNYYEQTLNTINEANKFNNRPIHTADTRSGKEVRKKVTNIQSSLTKVKNIYQQDLKAELKKKKRALLTQNSLAVGSPPFKKDPKLGIDLSLSPTNKKNDVFFDLRISPIRSSVENSFKKTPKADPGKNNISIEEMHSLDIENRSFNLRKKRYIAGAKLISDSYLKVRPNAPDFHFMSVNHDDSVLSGGSDIKFFSHNTSVNHNSSFMSGGGSTDTSILGDLNSENQSQSSLKSRRKLKLTKNQIWYNLLKSGGVKATQNIIPDDIRVSLKNEEQKSKNNKTLETIEHDERENESPTNTTSKNFFQSSKPKEMKIETLINNELNRIMIKENLKNIAKIIPATRVSTSEKNRDKFNLTYTKLSRKASNDRSNSFQQYSMTDEDKNGSFTKESPKKNDKTIEIALSNIKAPLPSKFPYKLVTEKHYDHSVAKLQKIRSLVEDFKKKFEEQKTLRSNSRPRSKKIKMREEIPVEVQMKTTEGASNSLTTEESDLTKEVMKLRETVGKKNDALKYLKFHYKKLKKKNITTAFNMLSRLVKRKAFSPAFNKLLSE